jgi:hypothetical protein
VAQVKPLNTRVIVGTGEPIEECNLVEFRLIYQGQLPSTGNKSRPREAQKIRQVFHPQLRRLWSVKRGLQELAEMKGQSAEGREKDFYSALNASWPQKGIIAMGKKWNKGGFDFVPLVTPEVALRCVLDILILRPEEKRYIFDRGDIDGQLATLFDALSMPAHVEQIFGDDIQVDEKPMFCLLQDDKLVSEVRVVADELLILPGERELRADDAFVVVHVRLNHAIGTTFDRWFE